jgi:Ser/Thr protein kinase RdoA (MazF antagonist)
MYEKLIPILQNFLEIDQNTEGPIVIENLVSGHINQTFKVTINGQNFILQSINAAIFPEPLKIMENIETVATHLKSKDYERTVLSFIKTKNNASLAFDTEGAAWRLMPFIEHTYSILKVENEQQAFIAAEAFGEYLSALSDLDVNKIHTILPNFHNADFRIQQHQDALKSTSSVKRLKNAEHDLAFIQQHIPYFENKKLNIPLRVTHNDTKISNILFDKTTHEVACIIDLDTLQTSTLLADFGDMVRSYTCTYDEDFADVSKVEMRFYYFEALLFGFIKKLSGKILEEEKNVLIFGAERTVFVQALRFMTDYLNNDTYYQTKYAEHNLVRAQNQLALFGSIQRQRPKMEALVTKILGY